MEAPKHHKTKDVVSQPSKERKRKTNQRSLMEKASMGRFKSTESSSKIEILVVVYDTITGWSAYKIMRKVMMGHRQYTDATVSKTEMNATVIKTEKIGYGEEGGLLTAYVLAKILSILAPLGSVTVATTP